MSKKIIKILGVRLNCVKKSFIMRELTFGVKNDKKMFLSTPNPEILLKALKNDKFINVLNSSYLNLTDGIGIIWASYFLKISVDNYGFVVFLKWVWSLLLLVFYKQKLYEVIPERVTGVDFMIDFCDVCAENGFSLFLLGAGDGVAEETSVVLKNRFPDLNIVGTFAGIPSVEHDDFISDKINKSGAEVLFVAYGAPKQELWIYRNLKNLTTVNLAIGIGGAFDFISGNVRRAPKLMRRVGMEWLFRLFTQPTRAKRIFNALIVFPYVVLVEQLKNK